MNWLPDLCAQIRNSGAPQAQTDALTLKVATLAALCDKFVPGAPAPLFERFPNSCDLAIAWRHRGRSLVLFAGLHAGASTGLYLGDTTAALHSHTTSDEPDYEQLRVAVTSFFDGLTLRDP